MSLMDRITKPGPKRLLAIDGGGIRGAMSLEVLLRIEQLLQKEAGPNYRLCDYFDYIAGTSTGGIIAAGLSVGKSVPELLDFYEKAGPDMFDKASLLRRLHYSFNSEPLAKKLQDVLGEDTAFGSDKLKTLLLLVLRNATTDSPWPLSNNPFAKYNGTARKDDNLDFPLWQLVRASTAAPTFFPPEVISVGEDKQFVFVDGGVTMYNNPAFQMFLMATMDCYWPKSPRKRGWETGADKMLIVSVGTGTSPDVRNGTSPNQMHLLFNATTIPSALMFAALNEQDLLCRVFGKCLAGDLLDRELRDVMPGEGPLPADQKLFTYVRYNAELTREGLDAIGCKDIEPDDVRKLDAVESIPQLREVGRAVANAKVKAAHFAGFAPPKR